MPDLPSSADQSSPAGLSRREFLQGAGAAAVAASATRGFDPAAAEAGSSTSAQPPRTAIQLRINGEARRLDVEDRWTLAEALRDQLRLTGTKLGCDRGECGACTVLMSGKPVYACSQLAVWADGAEVVTVEGLARGGEVTALQVAFMDHNAPQCGFCTSGQLMSATALLERNPRPSAEEVRAALVGNLCRCSNYNAIVEAVLAAAGSGGSQ